MLEVKLLGQFEVSQDGRRLAIPTRQAQSLFAYLILNAGKAHRREKLAGLLWPDSSENNARSNLRHELWRLRKTVDKEEQTYFLIDDLAITFDPDSPHSLDVKALERLSPESSAIELIEALSAYQGELLPGFYEEWVTVERSRLVDLYEVRLARLLEILEAEGRWTEVQEWAIRWTALGGWPEPAYRALMSSYANSGDLSKAVITYERFVEGLQKELGIQPSEQTNALYRRLKSGKGLAAQSDVPIGSPQSSPRPPKSASPTFSLPRIRRSNLPKPLTTFIGREKEIRQVIQQLSRSRLVTITGPGGVGKTRMAIQVATKLADRYQDRILWVELASLFRGDQTGENLVTQAVAKALRVPEKMGLPILEGIVENIGDQKLLLVFDNCEHLLDDCSALSQRLLEECPEVTILTTSREALGTPGEKAWLLPSLSLTESDQNFDNKSINQSEAVSLFIERAAGVLPDYQPDNMDVPVITQICQRLGGIPLAIELAAARMNLLSADEIAGRLNRIFSLLAGGPRTALPRHQTMKATIEWSYDLLSEAEQIFFRRLSIFAGSFTLEAAEAVCAGDEIQSDDVLSLIGRLVDKSLLSVEPGSQNFKLATRYRFLDTIRSFGCLKLDESGEARLMHDRHSAYYVHLTEALEPELLLQDQVHWFRLLQAENESLHAVIEWSSESDQAENALRLAGALLWFWFSYGSTREGCEMAVKALGIPSGAQFLKARARALNTAGFLQCVLGDTTQARQSLEEALYIQRSLGDKVQIAWSLQFLGVALANDQEYNKADAVFREGLALMKDLGGVYANNLLHFLGDVNLLKGDRTRAKMIYEESVSVLRAKGSKSFLAYPLRRLGYLALWEGDNTKALEYFRESLAFNTEIGDQRAVAASLLSLAALALELGKPEPAARLFGVVESRLESLSVNLINTDQEQFERIRIELPDHLEEAAITYSFNKGWHMGESQVNELVKEIIRDG